MAKQEDIDWYTREHAKDPADQAGCQFDKCPIHQKEMWDKMFPEEKPKPAPVEDQEMKGKPKLYKVEYLFTAMSIEDAKQKLAGPVHKEIMATLQRIPKKGHASRAERLSQAESLFEDAKSQIEDLKSEIEEWKNNLPENLQGGDKASQLEECESALEEIMSNMDNVEFGNVDFPGMF